MENDGLETYEPSTEDSIKSSNNVNETYKASESGLSRVQLAQMWETRIKAADMVYKAWVNRFKIDVIYQYYEGFQWFYETDENNRPYTINLIFSTIATKLPTLVFDNPQFSTRPRPIGVMFDEDAVRPMAQAKEDALNFVCAREDFGITDQHELAILDAFFGFGVLETDYSEDEVINPNISQEDKNPLNNIYCKHIPFDHFRVSANATWDLSKGGWYGYYDFIPERELYEKYSDKVTFKGGLNSGDNVVEVVSEEAVSGKITVGRESEDDIPPPGTIKVWRLWDFRSYKYCLYCPDNCEAGNRVLEYKTFKSSPLSFLRFNKRRKGWYPLPAIFNWIGPQDEINDIKQAERIHRKRFKRIYEVLDGAIEDEELQKAIFGPDGTYFKVMKTGAIVPVPDAPMEQLNQEVLVSAYDDMNRISGSSSERQNVADRTTATQASIMDQRAQVRDSKDQLSVGDFMVSFAHNLLRALRKVKKDFWIISKLNNEGLLGEVQDKKSRWTRISPSTFKEEDVDITLNVTSISPIYAQQDKKAFMEFLALITQYEMLSLSPALLREAAYKVGYKNEAVLKQFQQLALLASIGRLNAAKAAATPPVPMQPGTGGIQPNNTPGQLAQQQTDASTPPDAQAIMNTIFNRQGLAPS